MDTADHCWSVEHLKDLVNKTLISVPPEKPRIFKAKGTKIKDGEIDIRLENVTISLKCKVLGGFPSPMVSWWKDEVLVDSTFERYI